MGPLIAEVIGQVPTTSIGDLPLHIGGILSVAQIVKMHPKFPEHHLPWLCPLAGCGVGVFLVLRGAHAGVKLLDGDVINTIFHWLIAGTGAVAVFMAQGPKGIFSLIPGMSQFSGQLIPSTSAVPGASSPPTVPVPVPVHTSGAMPMPPPPPPH